jgi:hypothetical protein
MNAAPAPPPPPSVGLPTVADRSEVTATRPDQKPTGERAILESKLSPALLAAFDCWKESGSACTKIKGDQVDLQLFLTPDSNAAIEQLKALGFTISEERQKQRTVIGRLPVGKLVELAQMDAVRFVALIKR